MPQLGETILEPISEVGSFTCALGWLATCLSYCCGAAGKITRNLLDIPSRYRLAFSPVATPFGPTRGEAHAHAKLDGFKVTTPEEYAKASNGVGDHEKIKLKIKDKNTGNDVVFYAAARKR